MAGLTAKLRPTASIPIPATTGLPVMTPIMNMPAPMALSKPSTMSITVFFDRPFSLMSCTISVILLMAGLTARLRPTASMPMPATTGLPVMTPIMNMPAPMALSKPSTMSITVFFDRPFSLMSSTISVILLMVGLTAKLRQKASIPIPATTGLPVIVPIINMPTPRALSTPSIMSISVFFVSPFSLISLTISVIVLIVGSITRPMPSATTPAGK